jgi:hypothetical protein
MPILGIIASSISGSISSSSYESIATATGTGSSATITFSSIPSTYKHLQLRMNLIVAVDGDSLYAQLNGATSFTYHNLSGNGSAVTANGAATPQNAYIGFFNDGMSQTYPNVVITDIIDYASTTKNKTIRSFFGNDRNAGGGSVGLMSNLWVNTAAVNSISIKSTGSNFTTASTISLYGIKG